MFSSTTTIKASEVDAIIDEIEADIEVALGGQGVALPVTTPPSLVTWLGKLATDGAAATVLKAWFQDSGGSNSESAWSVWENRYKDGLARIRRGELPTEVDEPEDRGVSSFQTRHPDGVEAGHFGSASDPMIGRDTAW